MILLNDVFKGCLKKDQREDILNLFEDKSKVSLVGSLVSVLSVLRLEIYYCHPSPFTLHLLTPITTHS